MGGLLVFFGWKLIVCMRDTDDPAVLGVKTSGGCCSWDAESCTTSTKCLRAKCNSTANSEKIFLWHRCVLMHTD